MAKLKPPWVKTDIPKHVKIKLWNLMKDNTTFDTFYGQVSLHFDEIFSGPGIKKDKYGSLSRETYNGLRHEIRHMPVEEVNSLPSDLRVWIAGLRPELQGRLQLVNHTGEEGSLIIKDKERHFKEVWQLAREWSKQIYFYCDTEDEYATRKDYPCVFEPTDARSGTHVNGPLEWSVQIDGSVKVSFNIERNRLFSALCEHLPDDELWIDYEELKSCLIKGIQQAGKSNIRITVREEVSIIRKRLCEELETLLAKHRHWFPGRCYDCP